MVCSISVRSFLWLLVCSLVSFLWWFLVCWDVITLRFFDLWYVLLAFVRSFGSWYVLLEHNYLCSFGGSWCILWDVITLCFFDLWYVLLDHDSWCILWFHFF